ncbi:hypothetical protein [Flavobacterium sp.]|uniref:hypothetical protein n=1 Tax=Flavobacterium sp. TaxID=239 RepID=UPI003751D743
MNFIKIILSLILILTVSNSIAQKTNSDKIIGCWEITKFEFTPANNNSAALIKDALHAVVCFNSKGTFTSQKANDKTIINGKFNLSTDGTTLFQSSEAQNEATEEDAKIELLDDRHLILKTEYFIMSFDKI